MSTALVSIFAMAYAAIALEHPLRVNKSASALLAAGLLWTIYALAGGDFHVAVHNLHESLVPQPPRSSSFHGAMTIVEWSTPTTGFTRSPSRIKPPDPHFLLGWWDSFAFFLSAILDNLTTTLVCFSMFKSTV
jgi:Na+/H+ antiporter NhaD/arsenite permease-like protein